MMVQRNRRMEEFGSIGFLYDRDIENLRSLLHNLHRGLQWSNVVYYGLGDRLICRSQTRRLIGSWLDRARERRRSTATKGQ